MPRILSLAELRRFAIARSLGAPTTLGRVLRRLGFVQADPIRAPARAQDLILRHRVVDYRAGQLEVRYDRLPIDEDYFINYGFLPQALTALMHPRSARRDWTRAEARRAAAVLEFVRDRGTVHPADVDAHFAHGRALNWFGGQSRVSTQLLDAMHYRGMLRVVRRSAGTRVYRVRDPVPHGVDLPDALDRLVDVLLAVYAPITASTLGQLTTRLLWLGAPQWRGHRRATVTRALARVAHHTIDGTRWVWPADEVAHSARHVVGDQVRFLAPFDPIVWERERFERFWGWPYRFEAYTPAARRVRGYYALPLLWREEVIGWANLRVVAGRLEAAIGYVSGAPPRDAAFRRALEEEQAAMARFLELPSADHPG
jgi:uncharacterized protein YcaQ